MRRILLNRAQDKTRLKRGGDRLKMDLDQIELALDTPAEDLIALDEAIENLAEEDRVCAELVKLAEKVKVGNGLEEDTELGPLQNAKQLNIVRELAADARAAGATFLTGGEESGGPGYFYPPTIVTNISDGTRLVDEEPFGPIVPVIKYSDVDDAIARANASSAGLGGSIWSSDLETAARLVERLEAGSVWVNTHADIQPNAPMGGIKQSGIGCEFGHWGLEENTDIQTVKINKS